MSKANNILLAFYGDDFTGSTDALEFICRAGATAMLFIEPPTPDILKNYPHINALGVAGNTRALSPEEMKPVLTHAFHQLKTTGARHVHYKVCSTFDSSPSVGSIGMAIDCGCEVFGSGLIPVPGGMPALGRYCMFGNLFARMGIGSNGKVYRLDRHPSMSKHPVTPADESDLRIHLAKQTSKPIGLIDMLQLELPVEQWTNSLNGSTVVVIDAVNESQMQKIGEWMEKICEKEKTLFSVGSSGVELALGQYWNSQQVLKQHPQWPSPGPVNPLLVVSGSCSPVSKNQIEWALNHGFREIVIDAAGISKGSDMDPAISVEINRCLAEGNDVIVHTGEKNTTTLSSELVGAALGNLVKSAVSATGIKRVVVAGGDTSSYAARAMDIEAVEMIAPLVAGAPLCRVHSNNVDMHGLQVNFKGGQVGSDSYYGILKKGSV